MLDAARRPLPTSPSTSFHARGLDDLPPAHIPLAQHLDENGLRITDLAERAPLTLQTVVHTVNDLERGWAIATAPDPADARAKLVLMTSAVAARSAPASRSTSAYSNAVRSSSAKQAPDRPQLYRDTGAGSEAHVGRRRR
jgi:hypothetical protein